MSIFTICGESARRVVVKQSKINAGLLELQILGRDGEVVASMCMDGSAAGALCNALEVTNCYIDRCVVDRYAPSVRDLSAAIQPGDLSGIRFPLPPAKVQAYADNNGRAPSVTVGGA